MFNEYTDYFHVITKKWSVYFHVTTTKFTLNNHFMSCEHSIYY